MTLWYTARGAGLAALVVLSLATCLGAVTSVKIRSAATRVVTQYTHRAAAAVGLGLILVHVGALLADPKAGIGASGALVPFASAYRPNAVALGSIAAYVFIVVAALGVARGRLAASARAARAWRYTHTLAYAGWAAAMLHSINAGTDAGLPWVRTLWVACLLAVLGSVVVRLSGQARRRLVVGAVR
jgi:predicted ferric reductase